VEEQVAEQYVEHTHHSEPGELAALVEEHGSRVDDQETNIVHAVALTRKLVDLSRVHAIQDYLLDHHVEQPQPHPAHSHAHQQHPGVHIYVV